MAEIHSAQTDTTPSTGKQVNHGNGSLMSLPECGESRRPVRLPYVSSSNF